jgi:hypothetical protein
MKDYVNTPRPTAFQFWMRKNERHVQAAILIIALAIIGSIGGGM